MSAFELKSRDVEALRAVCQAVKRACENIRVSPIYGDAHGRTWKTYLSQKKEGMN